MTYTKLQGQHKLISEMFGAVRAFEMKLLLRAFRKYLENVNMCHFCSSDVLEREYLLMEQ